MDTAPTAASPSSIEDRNVSCTDCRSVCLKEDLAGNFTLYGDDGRVGTAGTLSTFMLAPRERIALNKYVGQQVQLTAVVLDPGEKDADVKVEEKVSVDPEHGDRSSKRTKTEIEVEGPAAHGQFTVMTVKPMGGACK